MGGQACEVQGLLSLAFDKSETGGSYAKTEALTRSRWLFWDWDVSI